MRTSKIDCRERFLQDVAGHQLTFLQDSGVNRHLMLKKPGSSAYWFEVLTWPGSLCIGGDMGTYVFARERDMFRFFRTESNAINRPYWSEKLTSCRREGVKEHSPERFIRNVVDYVRQSMAREDKAGQTELFREVREQVLRCAENEHDACDAAHRFEHKMPNGRVFEFHDFWEYDHTEFTHHFTWCCYAIVWAIQKYDEATASKAPA